MRKERVFKSVLISLILLGMVLFGYSLVTTVQAEDAATTGTVTGKLVLPEGITIPAGMQIGLYYIDYDYPPNPGPVPQPTATPPVPSAPRSTFEIESDLQRAHAPFSPIEENVYGPPVAVTSVDTETGEFLFPSVGQGVYVVNLLPPEGSYLMPAVTPYVDLFQSSFDLGDISVVEAQLAGTVSAPDSDEITEGYAIVMSATGSYYASARTVNGRYFMRGIPAGDYSLRAFPSYYQDQYFESEPVFITISEDAETLVQPLEYGGPDIFGTVLDADGNPYPETGISIYSIDNLPYSEGFAYSSFDGTWKIGNLRDGQYRLVVWNYNDYNNSSQIPPEPLDITIPTDGEPLELRYTAWPTDLKKLTGTVVDNNGVPVTDALVYAAHNEQALTREATTDGNGQFEFDLIGGTWSIGVYPIDYENADWTNYDSPIVISFVDDDSPEEKSLTIEVVRYDSEVRGSVVSPDPDVPSPGFYFSLYSNDPYFETGKYFEPGSEFSLSAPAGEYEYLIYPDSEYFGRVEVKSISLVSGETLDLGEIVLPAPNATIKGRVATAAGEPVANIQIYGYHQDGLDRERFATTDENGYYELKVIAGSWTVYAAAYDLPNYYYDGTPKEVTVLPDQIAEEINFVITELDSNISGSVVDSEGNGRLAVNGYVSALNKNDGTFYSEGPIINGKFDLAVFEGEYTLYINLFDTSLFFPREISVIVGANSTIEIEIQALEPNAQLSGQLIDFRSGEAVTGLVGSVWAYSEDVSGTAYSAISSDSGGFSLPLRDGTWSLDWNIESSSQSNYMQLSYSVPYISLTENSTVTVDLPIVLADASISGRMITPAGEPISYGGIHMAGQGELVGLDIYVEVGPAGNFSQNIPYGTYLLTAQDYFSEDGIFPPQAQAIIVEPGEVISDFIIEYQSANTPLTGSIFAPGLTESGEVAVNLNSANGGYKYLAVHLSSDGENGVGDFSVDLVDGKWYISANMSVGADYWYASGPINVNGPTNIDLVLQKEGYYYPPESAEIDAESPVTVQVEDGTTVNVPAGLFADDTLITHIGLETGSFLPLNGEMRSVGLNYLVMALDASFLPHWDRELDQTLTVTVPYPSEIAETVGPTELAIMLQSIPDAQSNVEPTIIEDVVFDLENRTITFQMDRLGYFGVVAPAEMMPAVPSFSDIFANKVYFSFISE